MIHLASMMSTLPKCGANATASDKISSLYMEIECIPCLERALKEFPRGTNIYITDRIAELKRKGVEQPQPKPLINCLECHRGNPGGMRIEGFCWDKGKPTYPVNLVRNLPDVNCLNCLIYTEEWYREAGYETLAAVAKKRYDELTAFTGAPVNIRHEAPKEQIPRTLTQEEWAKYVGVDLKTYLKMMGD